tara:strand:- start:57376 stop:59850 length:2475 start_codon:yes stop_codon:yes gene_type:complete
MRHSGLRTSRGDFNFGHGLGVAISALVMGLAYTPAHAQDASAAQAEVDDATVGEIIVTAQKREQSLNDVGMSISAISGDSLVSRGIQRLEDMSRVVPSFTVTKQEFDVPTYTLRGIGPQNPSLAGAPTVSIYMDQVPLVFPIMARGASLDLERVEVLKGPQGTIFGQNSTGGLVNYIAAKPTREFSAGINASYSRFDLFEGDFFVSGPIADNVQARLAMATSQGGAWQYSATRPGDTLGDQRFTRARLTIDAQPSEALRLSFSLNGWIDYSDTQAGQSVDDVERRNNEPVNAILEVSRDIQKANLNPRIADWDADGRFRHDDNFIQPALRVDLDLSSNVTVTSITEYAYFKRDSLQDGDGTAAINQRGHLYGNIEDFSQELRVSGTTADDRLNWTIGGNYQNSSVADSIDFEQNADAGGFLIPGLGTFIYGRSQAFSKIRSLAAFANAEYKVNDRITVSGGLRYTDNRTKFRSCTSDVGTGDLATLFGNIQQFALMVPVTTAPGECVTLRDDASVPPAELFSSGLFTDTLSENNLSWRLNVDWKPFDNATLIYANVSQGYKVGSYALIPANLTSQFPPATQEKLLAYEIGFKAPIAGRKFQLNGAAFYYDYTDQQLAGQVVTLFGPLNKLVNVPSSRLWGLELQAQSRPLRGLELNGSVTYLNSRILKNPDGTDFTLYPQRAHDTSAPIPLTGEEFPLAPEFSASADIQYDWDISSEYSAFVGAALTYQGRAKASLVPADPDKAVDIDVASTTTYNDPVFSLRPYALIDLRAGIKSEEAGWSVSIWGRNITNKYYNSSVGRVQDTIARYTGRPATYGITFGWKM